MDVGPHWRLLITIYDKCFPYRESWTFNENRVKINLGAAVLVESTNLYFGEILNYNVLVILTSCLF